MPGVGHYLTLEFKGNTGFSGKKNHFTPYVLSKIVDSYTSFRVRVR